MSDSLPVYLNDHLAGSVVALELLQHLEKVHPGTDLARFVAGLRADIEVDRAELEELMQRHEITQSVPRRAMAWLTEKAAELKLALDDASGGKLRLLQVMEVISLGIEGKRLLWRAMATVSEGTPSLRGPDYARLERRAEEQRGRVEAVRLQAAGAALVDQDQTQGRATGLARV